MLRKAYKDVDFLDFMGKKGRLRNNGDKQFIYFFSSYNFGMIQIIDKKMTIVYNSNIQGKE